MAITKVSRGLLNTGISDSSDATAITIDSSENVGIGTTSPASPLHVVGGASLGSGFTQTRSGHPSFGITNGNTDTVYFSIAPDGGSHQSFMEVVDDDTDVDSIKLKTSGSERMRINASGTLQIGKTSASATDAGHQFFGTGQYYIYSPATQAIRFYNTDIGSQAGHITISGSTISMGNGTSDLSTKENINDWNENVLESFKNIKPVTFNYKNDKTKEVKKGYIAQNEVDKFPEAYAKNSEDNLHWFYPSEMTVYLMKAIQEQQEIIDDLKARIEVLEA